MATYPRMRGLHDKILTGICDVFSGAVSMSKNHALELKRYELGDTMTEVTDAIINRGGEVKSQHLNHNLFQQFVICLNEFQRHENANKKKSTRDEWIDFIDNLSHAAHKIKDKYECDYTERLTTTIQNLRQEWDGGTDYQKDNMHFIPVSYYGLLRLSDISRAVLRSKTQSELIGNLGTIYNHPSDQKNLPILRVVK